MKELNKFKTKPSVKWQASTLLKLQGTLLVTNIENIRNSVSNTMQQYGMSLNNLSHINNMPKAISTLAALLVVFTVVALPAAASSDGVGPAHPLYGVDLLIEDIQLSLADDEEEEAELLEDQMEERTDEMEEIMEDGEMTEDDMEDLSEGQQLYEDALEAFGDTIDELCGREVASDEEGEEATDEVVVAEVEEEVTEEAEEPCDLDEKTLEKAEHVGEMTLKHLEVLARVYDKQVEKGNDNAADSLLGAMESSMNGHRTAVASVSKDKNSDEDDAETVSVEDFEMPDADGDDEDDDTDLTDEEKEEKERKNELKEKVKEQKEKVEKKVKEAKAKRGGKNK